MSYDVDSNVKANVKIIFALTAIHFIGDFYTSFFSTMLPLYQEKMMLSMTQIGLLTGVVRFLAFIVQPTVGYLSDRYQTKLFALCGVLLTILFFPLSCKAHSFYLLVAVTALGAIGSSMFHPSITGMVPLYSGARKGVCLSVFNTGGTVAFGIGPLFISWYIHAFGFENTSYTLFMGIFCLICVYPLIPVPISEGFQDHGFLGSIKESLGGVWKAILLIWFVMVLRAIVGQSFYTFTSIMLYDRGYSLVSIGIVNSLLITSGAISGLAAGYLSDRIGYKIIFLITHTLMTPILLLFIRSSGHWVYPGAFIAGFFLFATMTLGVVMAQELAPKGRSMVSSLMMGLAFGLGGFFSPLVGKLADLYSIKTVLFYISFIPVLTVFIIFFFPERQTEMKDYTVCSN
ncbi:MFS transporter [Desulfoluna spongiiphila]|uniref:MFS transporter n=1 Tax=Desulfoluna spongiiphila TaxID=419481 RepID=UPI001253C02F|nr:MFS transporter [Desulfoluna spongiiphila]VVS94981.1 mfs transporter superfamily [Desulfoluna spongiiphila]